MGLYVRLKLQETPVFARASERGETLKAPLVQVFRRDFRELLLGTFIMVATYGLFYLMTTWILSYAIGQVQLGFLGIGYRDFLILQLVSVLFFAALIPVAGYLADRVGRRKSVAGGNRRDNYFWFEFQPVSFSPDDGHRPAGQQDSHAAVPQSGHGPDGIEFWTDVGAAARTFPYQYPLYRFRYILQHGFHTGRCFNAVRRHLAGPKLRGWLRWSIPVVAVVTFADRTFHQQRIHAHRSGHHVRRNRNHGHRIHFTLGTKYL